jgi:hypothetical protein
MDPDMVRQQAEEEAASRIHARRPPPPDRRIEPVLPMGIAMQPRMAPRQGDVYPASVAAAPAIVTAGWRTALGIAATCVLGTTVGLIGGVMVGVKLQLVPWQGAAIGAAAGFVIASQVTAVALIQRGKLGRWRATGAGLRSSLVVLAIMAPAMFVLPHFIGAPVAPNAPFEIGLFWKSVAAGAMVALVVGGVVLRGALRQGMAAEGF